MIESNRDLFLQEILNHRREFCRRFNPAIEINGSLREVDYVLAIFILKRLNILAVHSDESAQGKFLLEHQDGRAISGISPVQPSKNFTALHLFHLTDEPSSAQLAAASDPGSLILLYGIAGETSAASLEMIAKLARQGTDAIVFVPRGFVPALWRSTAILLAKPMHRDVLIDALQDFNAAFAGSELDALKIAEENLELRASVQRLSMPGTDQGEQDRLRGIIAKLELELASIRRSTLQQEKAMIAAQAVKPAAHR